MFAEPGSHRSSVSGSREGGIKDKRRARKNSKPKTTFTICYPPPTSLTWSKLHWRPRPLLQLHKLNAVSRPLPAFEVIPTPNISARLMRAANKVFKAKNPLCASSLMVLRAEDYYSGESKTEKEARDVVAVIDKAQKEDGVTPSKAKIRMADGEEWDGYQLMNGGYEFSRNDEHGLGLTARWVPHKRKDSAKPGNKSFYFSTISSTTRRHPVIAKLSKSFLTIHDEYKIPDPSSHTALSWYADDFDEATATTTIGEQQLRSPNARLRSLIAVTSIWVVLKER